MLSDIYSDILSDIYSGILSDILLGIFSGSLSDIRAILSGILHDILSDIYSDMVSGIYSGILSAFYLTFYLAFYLAFYLTYFLAFHLTYILTFPPTLQNVRINFYLLISNLLSAPIGAVRGTSLALGSQDRAISPEIESTWRICGGHGASSELPRSWSCGQEYEQIIQKKVVVEGAAVSKLSNGPEDGRSKSETFFSAKIC